MVNYMEKKEAITIKTSITVNLSERGRREIEIFSETAVFYLLTWMILNILGPYNIY